MEENEKIEDLDTAVEHESSSLNQDIKENEERKEEGRAEKKFCKHCGKELKEDLNFCPKCGKPCDNTNRIRYCSGCGEIIENDAKFCPKCGTKVDAKINIDINGAEGAMEKITGKLSVKRVGIILATLVVLAVMVTVGIKVIPQIFVSSETLMSEGNYEKAYHKAKKDKKDNVLIENLISCLCKEAEDGLKDPSSFKLRDAWYESTDKKRIVLYISGKNSMGGTTNNYWLYTFSSDENQYKLFTAIDDMEEEDYKSYDDVDDKLEKLLNNGAREIIREIYSDDNKLDNDLVERINGLHSKDLLKNVQLLKEVKDIYPSDDSEEA